jgi:hypothetical protein
MRFELGAAAPHAYPKGWIVTTASQHRICHSGFRKTRGAADAFPDCGDCPGDIRHGAVWKVSKSRELFE